MRKLLRSRAALWLAGAVLLMIGFAELTSELLEGEMHLVDELVLEGLAGLRSPVLTTMALDITALGSATLVVLFSIVASTSFLFRGDRLAAMQIAIAAVCAPIASSLIKHFIERPRPSEIPRLVEVSGFSYPSGHSLSASLFYVTLAIVVWTRNGPRSLRVGALVLAITISLLVALSRSYLGVHYPSDTLAGITVGVGLALLLAGAFSIVRVRRAASAA